MVKFGCVKLYIYIESLKWNFKIQSGGKKSWSKNLKLIDNNFKFKYEKYKDNIKSLKLKL